MFKVGVREHIMIAHSFKGDVFGPAQKTHGATFVVDVEFQSPHMNEDGIVVDIGRSHTLLKEVLAPLNYQNLDELEIFQGKNTTTEFIAKHIFDSLASEVGHSAKLGPGSENLVGIRVRLLESHVAWASYEGAVGESAGN